MAAPPTSPKDGRWASCNSLSAVLLHTLTPIAAAIRNDELSLRPFGFRRAWCDHGRCDCRKGGDACGGGAASCTRAAAGAGGRLLFSGGRRRYWLRWRWRRRLRRRWSARLRESHFILVLCLLVLSSQIGNQIDLLPIYWRDRDSRRRRWELALARVRRLCTQRHPPEPTAFAFGVRPSWWPGRRCTGRLVQLLWWKALLLPLPLPALTTPPRNVYKAAV